MLGAVLVALLAPAAAFSAVPAGTVTVDAPSGTVPPGTVVFRGGYQGAGGIDQHVSYAVDVSGSTESGGNDCDGSGSVDTGDDFNGDGAPGTTLDCEIAGVVALNSSLRDRATPLKAALIGFGSAAAIADMTPAGGDDAEAETTADANGDRVPDVQQVAASLDTGALALFRNRSGIGSGTDFATPLNQFQTLVTNAHPPVGSRGQYTLFFLSDGQASYPSSEIDALKQAVAARSDLLPVVVNTVSVGSGGAGCGASSPLEQIASALGGTCTDVEPGQLQAVLGETKPVGLDRIEVQFAGGTKTAAVDALGGWTASFPNVPASPSSYPYTVTAFREDGTTDVKSGSVAVRTAKIRYVALGDSYSAGWGLVPYFRPGDPDAHADFGDAPAADPVKCGRSPLASAFSVKLPNATVSIDHDPGAEMRFRACGGAVSVELVGRPQHPKEAGPQVRFIDDSTDLVTLTMGGNDVNFANIIKKCATNTSTDCQTQPYLRLNSGLTLTLDEFTDLRLALVHLDLLDALRTVRAKAPNSTVLVADYPHLLSVTAPGHCQEEAAYSRGEREWLASGVDRMGTIIERAAREAGVFSTSVISAFSTHEKCGGGQDWMYGVEASGKKTGADDEQCTTGTTTILGRQVSQTGCIYARSFHPRQEGAAAYGRAYTARLAHLAAAPPNGLTRSGLPRNPEPELPVAAARAAQAAPTSRALDALTPEEEAEVRGFTADAASVSDLPEVQGTPTPDACVTQLRVLPGQVLVVSGSGFASGTEATPTVAYAGQTTTLSRVVADSDGNATVALIMPTDIGSDPVVVFALAGTGADGFQRATTTALLNGHGDSDCVAAQRAAGLLSTDGTTLPQAAASFWDRSQMTALPSPGSSPSPVASSGPGSSVSSVTGPAPLALVAPRVRAATQSVTSSTTPKRKRTRPYVFTTAGRVVAPPYCAGGAAPSVAGARCVPRTAPLCTGLVTVVFKKRGNTISSRSAGLRPNCTYRSRVSFDTRRDPLRRGALTVSTRFQGNTMLLPKTARTYVVRAGGASRGEPRNAPSLPRDRAVR
jgi:hypothetical protein